MVFQLIFLIMLSLVGVQMFIYLAGRTVHPLGFGLGPTVTKTKRSVDQLSVGPTVWVELSVGLNEGGLKVKATYNFGEIRSEIGMIEENTIIFFFFNTASKCWQTHKNPKALGFTCRNNDKLSLGKI